MSKNYFKRAVVMFISFVMLIGFMPNFSVSAICCRKDGFDKSKYTLTGNMAEDVATIAKSQKGRTEAQFGYSGVDAGAWCDEFVADCLENAGADSSIVAHGGTVADFESKMRARNAVEVSSPRTGDLIFFTKSHVEIVTRVENGVVYCAGGNNGGRMCKGERTASSVGTTRLFLRPNYPDIHIDPPTVSTEHKYYAPSSNITITWNSVSGANGYWIDIWKDGEHILSENLGNSTSYTLSNSLKGGYGVFVTALTSGNGDCSEACSFYVQDVEAPQVSTDRELYAQNSNVNITWTSSTGATSYWIDVWVKGEHIVTERVNDTKYILQNCSLGTYSVFVTALTETGGFSSARNEAYHFTVGEIEAPTVSTERKYYAPDSDVEIKWTESKGNTSYWIDIWVKGEHIVTEQLKETTSYTLKNCKEGTYAVYVTAMMDTGGYSSARKEAYIFYVKEIEAPLVSTDKVYYNSEDDVIISWSASDGATSYWIDIWYREQLDNPDESATHIVSKQLSADSTVYVLENCANGKYAVYITAQENTGGHSSARNPSTPFYVTTNGDVNIDGKFNVADVVLLQKWLLAVPDTELVNWKAADLCEDGRLDVFDLCMMKRMLVENS